MRLAELIDHTLLLPEATRGDIERHCAEAAQLRFATVCVQPRWVATAARLLAGTSVGVATVIGFPFGATTTAAKVAEARDAVAAGATELDVVAALGAVHDGDRNYVRDDLRAVVDATRDDGALVKVIVESASLAPHQVVAAARLAAEAGAHFVKTSTGFHRAGGATPEAVLLLRMAVGDVLGVKASGGVRDGGTAALMIANGATRIGTSSGVAMAELRVPGPRPLADLLLGGGTTGGVSSAAY